MPGLAPHWGKCLTPPTPASPSALQIQGGAMSGEEGPSPALFPSWNCWLPISEDWLRTASAMRAELSAFPATRLIPDSVSSCTCTGHEGKVRWGSPCKCRLGTTRHPDTLHSHTLSTREPPGCVVCWTVEPLLTVASASSWGNQGTPFPKFQGCQQVSVLTGRDRVLFETKLKTNPSGATV